MTGIHIQSLFLKYQRDDAPLLDVAEPFYLPLGCSLLVAPSGSGKTTFFRLLSGWYSPDHHPDATYSSQIGLDPYRETTLVGNHASMLPWMKVMDNISLRAPDVPVSRIVEIASEIGLGESALQAWPYELSLGMYKRVEFISALFSNRQLLLLDEFFASLDESLRTKCLQILLEIRTSEQTTIMSTHMPESLPLGDIPVLKFKSLSSGTIVGLGVEI